MDLVESWKPIKGYPGYQVSQSGLVRSFRRSKIPKILKTPLRSNGYPQVSLRNKHGAIKNCLVHRVVAEAFLKGPWSKPNVLHKDGDKTNNAIWNLYWGTQAENAEDAFKHGALNMGEKHYKSKLSKEDVLEIRLDLLLGVKQADIARRYGVHKSTINAISTKKNWRRTV